MTATLNEDCNDDKNDHDNNGDVNCDESAGRSHCAQMACRGQRERCESVFLEDPLTYHYKFGLIKFIFVVMAIPISFLCWGLKSDPWVDDVLTKRGAAGNVWDLRDKMPDPLHRDRVRHLENGKYAKTAVAVFSANRVLTLCSVVILILPPLLWFSGRGDTP